jgi:hypothetical protein
MALAAARRAIAQPVEVVVVRRPPVISLAGLPGIPPIRCRKGTAWQQETRHTDRDSLRFFPPRNDITTERAETASPLPRIGGQPGRVVTDI